MLEQKTETQGDLLHRENQELREEIARLRTKVMRLESLVETDTLTPLANRRAFMKRLEQEICRVVRHGTVTTLVFADVDGLKIVNDRHGHLAGDAVLQHVSHALLASFRTTDMIARFGGDEFALILDHADEAPIASRMAALAVRLRNAPLEWNGQSVAISLSCGHTLLRGEDSPAEAINRADSAMYAAKTARS